jgi:hypothetical protein
MLDGVAAGVQADTMQGGKEEGWGSRVFLMHDAVPVSVLGRR